MHLIHILSFVVMVAGLLLFLLIDPAKYPRIAESGKLAYFAGLLTFLLMYKGSL